MAQEAWLGAKAEGGNWVKDAEPRTPTSEAGDPEPPADPFATQAARPIGAGAAGASAGAGSGGGGGAALGAQVVKEPKEEGGAFEASQARATLGPLDDGDSALLATAARASRIGPPCPQLITGSRLDKVVDLPPNHWLKVGRHPKAQLLLNNPGISRSQCSIRWDSHERKVELRVESTSGTAVNGRPLSLDRVYLEHGDRIRIIGKGQLFDFVVDLRPVGFGVGDPRQAVRVRKAQQAPPARRDRLRAMLVGLNKSIDLAEKSAFDKEQEFYEIQTRRRLRSAEIEEMEEKYQFFVEDQKRLEEALDASRKEWMDKIDKAYEANENAIRPVVVETANLQDKVEKLQLKKDELARSIHPERYAVADVSVMDMDLNPRDEGRDSGLEDEEDAFAGLSGLENERASGAEASGTEDEAAVAKKAAAAPKATTGGEEGEASKGEAPKVTVTAGGDLDTDDEEEDAPLQDAKRQKTA